MKNKLIILIATASLLTGCAIFKNNQAKDSSHSDVSSDSPTSESSSSDPISSSSDSESSESSSSSSESEPLVPPIEEPYDYDGYYADLVSWENGEDLKNQLHDIIHGEGYNPVPYTKSSGANWLSNTYADRSLTDFNYVDGVYSSIDIDKTKTQKGWQREHAFCATLMTGSLSANAVNYLGRATDFHNLFAAEAYGNNSRGNKNFGFANKTLDSYVDRTINNGDDGYSFDEKNFEPGNRDKGRLARAIFYMATMYSEEEYDDKNNVTMKGLTIVEDYVDYVSGNNCKFAIGNLSDLLEWNSFSVDYLEMQHNLSVYSDEITLGDSIYTQGNRNPYVDYPELVDYVYGSKKNQAGSLKDVKASALELEMDKDEIDHYSISYAKRDYLPGDTLTSIDYSVVAMKKNFTFNNITSGVTNSLDNHTFTESDPSTMEVTITVNGISLKYTITVGAMNTCSYQSGVIKKDGLSVNTTSQMTYNEKSFDVTPSGESGMAFTNTSSGGEGFSMGSGTSGKNCYGIIIQSRDEFTLNKAFIKCRANNKNSTFTLKVMVGDTVVLNNITITNNNDEFGEFGGTFTPITGRISFIITGSNALRINSFAFNIVE